MENEKMNEITWTEEQENKRNIFRWNLSFCIFHSSNVLQPGNFTSLNNGTPMPVKNPKNLYKTGIGRLQENESFKKLDGIEDAINDSLRT